LPDPRIIQDGMNYTDFKEQYDLCMKVIDLYKNTALLAEAVNEELDQWAKEENEELRLKRRERIMKDKLGEIKAQIVTRDDIRYPQPMLQDQLMYLYSMISRSDQKPGKDAYRRYDELEEVYQSLRNEYASIME
ncbi:MAG: hypothetical protein KFF49_10880, partial [Bacteroidales bacterium]|nr:hypothetical protein [Bacteroidales bacterium]